MLYIFLACGIVLLILATMVLRWMGLKGALEELGLTPVSAPAILSSTVAVVSMVVVVVLAGRSFAQPDGGALLALGIAGPFGEELLFRGFIFRQLRRWAGAPFWLAALISSLLFGLGHYSQGDTVTASLIAAGVTFIGGVFSAG